jgi:hypothetical protein
MIRTLSDDDFESTAVRLAEDGTLTVPARKAAG